MHCQKLTALNLCTVVVYVGYCQNITDGAVMSLLEKLPKLEKVDIQNTNIT